jgi:hypothetical protein
VEPNGIAKAFGVKDKDPRIEWKYTQHKGGVRVYRFEVEIRRNTHNQLDDTI